MSKTATVTTELQYTQFLDANAQLRAPLPVGARDTAMLLELYRRMVETRIFDKTALALQRSGQFGEYTAFLGQEAIVSAVAATLQPADILVGADRGYTLQNLHGAQLLDVLQHWSAAQHGSAESARRQFAHAVEIAASLKHDTETRIALAPGDARLNDPADADAQPVLDAGLPLILIAAKDRSAAPNAEDAGQSPLPIFSERVDGNDVIAMRDALQRALAQARNGQGPRLIEALVFPLTAIRPRDHQQAGRTPADVRAAWEHCPIKRLKRYLESRRLWTIEDEEALLLAAGEQANAAAANLRRGRSS